MKKKFLTAMLFFAFLFVGIQSSFAQSANDGLVVNAQYVSPSAATALLSDEITALEENPIIAGEMENHPQFPQLFRKLNFYVTVYEGIVVTSDIPDSIIKGAEEANDIQDEGTETFDTYLTEIVQLLSQ